MTDPTDLAALAGARVLITGGAGLIGTALRSTLARAGATVRLLDNLSAYESATLALLGTGPLDPDLTVGDSADGDLVRALVADADYVVHAAAHSTVQGCANDPATAFRSNLAATDTVLRAVADTPQVRRLVLLSTAQVYGNGDPGADPGRPRVFTEDAPVRPLNLYASAKTWAEFHTRQLLAPAGREFTVLRPFSVYGPGQVPKPGAPSWVIAQFSMYAALGQQLPLNNGGRQVRDFLYLDDAAHGIAHSLLAPGAAGQTLNLGTGVTTSVRQVAELVCWHYPAAEIVDTPRPAQDPLGARADTTRMCQALSWRPAVSVDQGLTRYVDWIKRTPEAIPHWLRAETTEGRIAAWNPAAPARA
ncbi:NAD-dependent epimerase/dehydratase family protein [Kitasatospora sp. NPDC059088]|uniref:NAD-dependent epimerase/dehydratase family protein n=1 Tax=Kitasatospora sp. NPDC059088 TaxID=3346722 RepID=UPI0036BC3D77